MYGHVQSMGWVARWLLLLPRQIQQLHWCELLAPAVVDSWLTLLFGAAAGAAGQAGRLLSNLA
jgi:hypothetical protein